VPTSAQPISGRVALSGARELRRTPALRQIGTLPGTTDPRVLGDYLLSIGVSTRAIKTREDDWAIWVHNEDLLTKAREAFAAYRANPDDPVFHSAGRIAEEVRTREEKLNREYRKNVRNLSGTWDSLNVRRRPLTSLIVGVCIALFLVQGINPAWGSWLFDHLEFFSSQTPRGGDPLRGLDEIHRLELWRLFTPCLLHANLLHIAFNMWATVILGTLVESRRGTRTLLVLVLLSGVGSNVGQFVYMLNVYQQLVPWVGFSGVVYAMFGYIWMKGTYEPEQGMMFHPTTVRIMLLWLLLGFAGFGGMANGAHVVGLIIGVLYGLARF
jgi:GlpG protein